MADGRAVNVITELPLMTWRGLESPPYDIASFSGRHDQSPRNWAYIDGAGHDHTGRSQFSCQFKLYFINTLKENAFPEMYSDWVEAVIFDGTPDKLVHPLLGEVDAVPTDFSVELVAQSTGGVIMTVTFEDTVIDPDDLVEIKGVQVNLKEMARKADAAGQAADIEYPDGERTDDLFDIVSQIESLVFSLRTSINGLVNQAFGIINKTIDQLEALGDHLQWATIDIFVSLYGHLADLADRMGAKVQRATAFYDVPADHSTTLDAVADEVGNTVGEIMTLNANLLGAPSVAGGSRVKYFIE